MWELREAGGTHGWQVMLVTCLGFATACVPDDEHRVSDLKQLLQLHDLQHEAVLCLQLELHNALLDDLRDKAGGGAGRRPLVWMSFQVLALMSPRSHAAPEPQVQILP